MDNLKCEFKSDGFTFVATPPKSEDFFKLFIEKTREDIVPAKCKYYIRKTKIYIALAKVKETEEWYTLKGVS